MTGFTKPRLIAAMCCYALLALLASLTLRDLFLAAVLVILAGLAAKTVIGYAAQKQDDK